MGGGLRHEADHPADVLGAQDPRNVLRRRWPLAILQNRGSDFSSMIRNVAMTR